MCLGAGEIRQIFTTETKANFIAWSQKLEHGSALQNIKSLHWLQKYCRTILYSTRWYLGFRVSRDDSETGQQPYEVHEYDGLSAQIY